jgi:outer membrane biogenesis lipoprotein LolB
MQQNGWHIDYLAYHQSGDTALPAKLKMSNPSSIQATLIINEWLLGNAACR